MLNLSSSGILAQANQICRSRNVRMTPQRAEVLQLMARHVNAITAYDLLDKLRQVEPQAKPPTVYRALEFLLAQGFIHRIESTNSYVVCPNFTQPLHTSVMLICSQCHSVSEQQISSIDTLINQQARKTGFEPRHNVVEVQGLCADCLAIEQCNDPAHCQHDHRIPLTSNRTNRNNR
jgi:Fur family transcriptional regulator, zinc uptake regulator